MKTSKKDISGKPPLTIRTFQGLLDSNGIDWESWGKTPGTKSAQQLFREMINIVS
jgi:hypothetical protein